METKNKLPRKHNGFNRKYVSVTRVKVRQDSSSEFIKVSELQNIQVQQLDGVSHPQ